METDAPKKRAKEQNEGPAAKKAKEEDEEEDEFVEKDQRTLFVRNLPFSVDEDQVVASFMNK